VLKLIKLTLSFCLFFSSTFVSSQETQNPRLGVWITVFSKQEILYSTDKIDALIENCTKSGINDIYLQIYRANKAYYDSDILSKDQYKKMLDLAGEDTIKYLLEKASKNNIKVHAWLNLFSIAKNKNADIIKKLGESCITKDRKGRTSLPEKGSVDKSHILEKQLFLEPGDHRVRSYLIALIKEIMEKYPKFSGIHFDYVRYPSVVPFLPGSRFYPYGVTYGYTEYNIKAFQSSSGLDARKMEKTRKNFHKWDEWKRQNINGFLKESSNIIKQASPNMEISCTIVSSIERTYLTTFQDWTKWIEEGYIDYVIVMNYTDDRRLLELSSNSFLFPKFKDKVQIGIGAYLLNKTPSEIIKQINILLTLSPGGIVIFSYDDVAKNGNLKNYLAEKFQKEIKD